MKKLYAEIVKAEKKREFIDIYTFIYFCNEFGYNLRMSPVELMKILIEDLPYFFYKWETNGQGMMQYSKKYGFEYRNDVKYPDFTEVTENFFEATVCKKKDILKFDGKTAIKTFKENLYNF